MQYQHPPGKQCHITRLPLGVDQRAEDGPGTGGGPPKPVPKRPFAAEDRLGAAEEDAGQ